MIRLDGVVLVTGGTSGIGRATAALLAEDGATVYAASRTAAGDVETYPSGGSVHPVVLDVTDPDSVRTAVAAITAEAGPIGVLIHSAGIGIAGAGVDTPDEAVRRQFATNLFGVVRVNAAVLPAMIAARRGRVVLVSSVAAQFPIPYQSHYAASKAALESYGRALRMELAAYGIGVTLVEPGDTKTGFTAARTYDIPEGSVFAGTARASVARMEHDEINGRDPATVARRVRWVLDRSHPPVRTIVGLDYQALSLLARLLPVALIDRVLRAMYVAKP